MARIPILKSFEEEDDGKSMFEDDEPPMSNRKARWAKLAKIAEEFDMFRPASEVLGSVRAVPTIFPGFDHATRVGGLPIERFTLVHGESAGGKSSLVIGFCKSFLKLDHFAVLIDAERTTSIDWLKKIMGEYAEHPLFFAQRPQTYEKTVSDVRFFVNKVKKLRDAGKLSEDSSAIIVVDSIRKLVPEDQFKKISQLSKQGGKKEKVRDRSAQIKAAMNSAWMDEIVPLLEETKTSMVVIARETEDPDASIQAKLFGSNYKVGGGKALYYDASMALRVERARFVGKKISVGDRESLKVYGERFRITIRKSKVANKGENTQTICYFHTSNGILIPEGFDTARDLIELAQTFGIFDGGKKSAWISYRGHKWQGENAAVKELTADPKLLSKLEKDVREHFESYKPLVVSEDGEILNEDEE